MKREYINVSKLSIETGISYDRIMRAVRFDLFDVFTVEEKHELAKANAKFLNQFSEENEDLKKNLGFVNELNESIIKQEVILDLLEALQEMVEYFHPIVDHRNEIEQGEARKRAKEAIEKTFKWSNKNKQ